MYVKGEATVQCFTLCWPSPMQFVDYWPQIDRSFTAADVKYFMFGILVLQELSVLIVYDDLENNF